MPRRTHDEAMQTRNRILDAAAEHCAQRGYEALSLELVAETAGVTRGAIYHHFEGKEGLFRALVIRRLEWMGRAIERAAAEAAEAAVTEAAAVAPRAHTADPGSREWRGLVAGCVAFLRESQDPAYQRIILLDGPAVLGIEAWQDLDSQYTTKSLVEALHDLERSGEIDVPDVVAAGEALSGAMNQLSLWVCAGHDLRLAEQTIEALLAGIRSSSAR